jgi:hypothetical protein
VRNRHHEVAPRVSHQPFDLALVVALARSAETVGEQIVRLQFAEDPGPARELLRERRWVDLLAAFAVATKDVAKLTPKLTGRRPGTL